MTTGQSARITRTFTLSAAMLAIALLAGSTCKKSEPDKPLEQTLTVTTISDPRTFNPIIANESSSSSVLSRLFIGLVKRNHKTLEIEPDLAESWTTSEDGTTWDFKLRAGLKWSDGHPLTATDVVFTFEAMFDPNVPNPGKDIFSVGGEPMKVEALGGRTVRVSMKEPFAPFLQSMGIEIIPEHKLRTALTEGKFNEAWNINTDPSEIVCNGPWVIDKYLPNQYVIFKPNPHYWRKADDGGQLPLLRKLTLVIVANTEAAMLKFEAGETDIYSPSMEQAASLIQKSELPNADFVVKKLGLGTGWSTFVTFNMNERYYKKDGDTDPKFKWFTDPKFKRGLALAIDTQAIINNVFLGYGEAAAGFTSPEVKNFFHEGLKPLGYDPAKAAATMDEAGYKDTDGDGKREDPAGNTIEFNMITNGDSNPVREKIATIIKQDWEKLGITVNYRPLDFNSLVEKLNATFDWDAIIISLTGGPEPHFGANVHRSVGFTHLWNPRQDKPATAWEAEVDKLVDAGARELDPAKRAEIYKRIQQIYYEQLPFIVTARQYDFIAYRNTVKGYDPTVWGYDADLIYRDR